MVMVQRRNLQQMLVNHGWVMKLSKDLQTFLKANKSNDGKLPFWNNFLSYTEEFTGGREFLHYLFFIQTQLKEYHVSRTLLSFEEYLNANYPPKIKIFN